MFLKVSTNNYASTVLSAFVSAVDEFGLPSRIRIDKGGENYLVSQFMLEHPERGPNRYSVITGRSVHNQRIERLWRDLYSGCICFFTPFFIFLKTSFYWILIIFWTSMLFTLCSFLSFKVSWTPLGKDGLIILYELRETRAPCSYGSLD